MLRQLGNSFIVQPNVLKSYMTESHLGKIDTRLLRPYLAQRSDYHTFSKTLVLDDGLPVDSVASSSSSSTIDSIAGNGASSHLSRVKSSRLSTMTGVAGVGMGKLKDMLKELDTPTEQTPAQRKELEKLRAYPTFFPMH